MHRLIEALQNPDLFPHPVRRFQVIETHLSWVLLTGLFAYKIKKPINLGFADFSTLEKRRYYCEQEILRNTAFTERLYLDVVPLYGSQNSPRFIDDGHAPIEYAVKMHEFPQENLLKQWIAEADPTEVRSQLQALAERIAHSHQHATRAAPDAYYGSFAAVCEPILDNFRDIKKFSTHPDIQDLTQRIETWHHQTIESLRPLLAQRKRDGFIRNGHGDLHSENIVFFNKALHCFDCIEFNLEFQWIDTMNDLAFLIMDLEFRGHVLYASQLLNHCLHATGDYQGLVLLNFYKSYRALVRAKTTLLTPSAQSETIALRYLQYAYRLTQTDGASLILMHGYSGSGKSHLCRRLNVALPFVMLKTDVYRRQLESALPSAQSQDKYTAKKIQDVYEALFALSALLLQQGHCILVDGTFLKQSQRQLFTHFARQNEIAYVILNLMVEQSCLQTRIEGRLRHPGASRSEANLSVLEKQVAASEPLDTTEQAHSVTIPYGDAFSVTEIAGLVEELRKKLNKIS